MSICRGCWRAASRAETVEDLAHAARRFLPVAEPAAAVSAERAQRLPIWPRRTARRPTGGDCRRHPSPALAASEKHFFKWALTRRYLDREPLRRDPPDRPPAPRQAAAARRSAQVRRHGAGAARTLEVGATAALMQNLPRPATDRGGDPGSAAGSGRSGRVLWVPFGKTSNARRRLQVQVLREILLQHAHGKPAESPLLRSGRRGCPHPPRPAPPPAPAVRRGRGAADLPAQPARPERDARLEAEYRPPRRRRARARLVRHRAPLRRRQHRRQRRPAARCRPARQRGCR